MPSSPIDPDMARIVDFCYRHGLSWDIDTSATEISFRPYYYKTGDGIIATFKKEDDPDYVLEWLQTYFLFDK